MQIRYRTRALHRRRSLHSLANSFSKVDLKIRENFDFFRLRENATRACHDAAISTCIMQSRPRMSALHRRRTLHSLANSVSKVDLKIRENFDFFRLRDNATPARRNAAISTCIMQSRTRTSALHRRRTLHSPANSFSKSI